MNYCCLLMCTVVLASLMTFISAEGDPLSDSSSTDSATKEELKSTMQSDIFNVGHNGMSNSTSASSSNLTPIVITRVSQSTITTSKTAAQALSTKVSGNWHLVADRQRQAISRSVPLTNGRCDLRNRQHDLGKYHTTSCCLWDYRGHPA
jgi:hypothetical protein